MTWWGSRRGTSVSDNTEKSYQGAFWLCMWVPEVPKDTHSKIYMLLFIPPFAPTMQDPQMLDQLAKNITRCGLSNSTLNYLRVRTFPVWYVDHSLKCIGTSLLTFLFLGYLLKLCVILEPMQELMSRHKTYSLSPRDCLKTCLFQKWQRMVAPPGNLHTEPSSCL